MTKLKEAVTDVTVELLEHKNSSRIYWMRPNKGILSGDSDKGLNESVIFEFGYTDYGKYSESVGHVTFAPMPGCCGIVISTNLSIELEHRGTVYSKIFQETRIKLAWKLGYSKILATIQMDNIPQVVSAAKNDWKFISTFTNKRTGNLLAIIERTVYDRADYQ